MSNACFCLGLQPGTTLDSGLLSFFSFSLLLHGLRDGFESAKWKYVLTRFISLHIQSEGESPALCAGCIRNSCSLIPSANSARLDIADSRHTLTSSTTALATQVRERNPCCCLAQQLLNILESYGERPAAASF